MPVALHPAPMPRRARRLQCADYYHIINRGSVRARVFHDDDDYQTFVLLLGQAVARFELPLLSYCVMPNHWHLVVKPTNQNHLSKSMHWLTVAHAARWSRAHPRRGPGPIYQGRFKSIPVEPGLHLLRACRYVERNGLRADFAPRAEQWPWSSAAQRVENRDVPPLEPLQFVTPTDWLVMLNEQVDDDEVRECVRRNRPYASEEWVRSRYSLLGISIPRAPGRPRKMNN